ncbi:hypothetical protein MTO96_000180 [Rhipicephalus appendiculatus]
MAGGHQKFRTAHAFGKKRRRRPRARSVSPARPSAAENTEEAGCANAITNAIAGANDHTRAVRVDTPLVSDAEKVAIECRASDIQRDLSSTSATRRKRSFFRDSEAAATTGTPFTVVSLAMVNELLQYMKCEVQKRTIAELVASEKKHMHAENFRRAMKRKRTKENDDDYTPGGF